MSANLEGMYREIVLDHHRHPRGRGAIEHVDEEAKGKNPNCGDEVTVRLSVEGERVRDIQVVGQGCAISVASGSILHDMVKSMSLEEARELAASFRKLMRGQEVSMALGGDLEALEGVKQYPMRVKCALLPWTTLEEILKARAEARSPVSVSTEHRA